MNYNHIQITLDSGEYKLIEGNNQIKIDNLNSTLNILFIIESILFEKINNNIEDDEDKEDLLFHKSSKEELFLEKVRKEGE